MSLFIISGFSELFYLSDFTGVELGLERYFDTGFCCVTLSVAVAEPEFVLSVVVLVVVEPKLVGLTVGAPVPAN